MGDMADQLIEDGQQGWWAHLAGDCEYRCPYCEEDERVTRSKQRTQRALKKRATLAGKGRDERPGGTASWRYSTVRNESGDA